MLIDPKVNIGLIGVGKAGGWRAMDNQQKLSQLKALWQAGQLSFDEYLALLLRYINISSIYRGYHSIYPQYITGLQRY